MTTPKKTKRKALSKRVRFEVFKRDKFTCQYCGKAAPDVVLVIDHIDPVANGGTNDVLNLITSCDPCNAGKGARALADDSVVSKQRTQLAAMQERREQLAMMVEWQKGLASLETAAVDAVANFYSEHVPGWSLSASGREDLRAALVSVPLPDAMTMLRETAAKHLRVVNGKATEESSGVVTRAFFGALKYHKLRQKDPVGADLLYIRGIVRNRTSSGWNTYRASTCLDLLREAYAAGIDPADLKADALALRSWNQWVNDISVRIAEARAEGTPP